ncbi:PepSY domain-containing protein [Sinorhizobium fredii]|uniref:PepSY domain-containing protein n=1 Tax=Rhizobium fredii TaxID=380 RepID=UPI001FCA53EA|nr:hypothetical protein [Sinorhizobium fredii]
MDEFMRMTRRDLMAIICCSYMLPIAVVPSSLAAFASNSGSGGGGRGSGGSGSSGSGSSGSGSSGSGSCGSGGSSNSGSGSGNSGHGANADDDDDNSGPGGRRDDQERAREAVAKGCILPLKDVLRLVDKDKYGSVISLDLGRYNGSDVYRLKTRDGRGTIRNLRINARTGKFMKNLDF